MLENERAATLEELIPAAKQFRERGARFITITTVDCVDHFDLIYSFSIDGDVEHLRLSIADGTVVPSIADVYFGTFLVENEIQDLFGLKFSGLPIDYGGKLYMTEGLSAPLRKNRPDAAVAAEAASPA